MNKQPVFFQKIHSFIASKSTFEFISRYKDVQESHLKQNKQFLEQTQAALGLMGHLCHQLKRPEKRPKHGENDMKRCKLSMTV